MSRLFEKPVSKSHQSPGTMLRVFLPAGNVVNLLNYLEISAPDSTCLMIRIPGRAGSMNPVATTVIDSLRQAGATVEVSKED